MTSRQTGSISDVCEASANLCRTLERQAFQAEFEERQQPDPKPRPSSDLTVPSSPEETIAAQLQRLRLECDLTEEALAEQVNMDIRSVQRHLAGESVPRALSVRKYERAFSKLLNRQVVIRQVP
jgi:ribosome-binding protein aMBF1 (putative translation factor)